MSSNQPIESEPVFYRIATSVSLHIFLIGLAGTLARPPVPVPSKLEPLINEPAKVELIEEKPPEMIVEKEPPPAEQEKVEEVDETLPPVTVDAPEPVVQETQSTLSLPSVAAANAVVEFAQYVKGNVRVASDSRFASSGSGLPTGKAASGPTRLSGRGGAGAPITLPPWATVYPPEAAREKASGTVVVRFVFDQFGNITEAKVAKGSGFRSLDSHFLRAIRNGVPKPEFMGVTGTYDWEMEFTLN